MTEWHIGLILEEATDEQAAKLFDDIVKMVDDRGMAVSGGLHPTADCNIKIDLPAGKYRLYDTWLLDEDIFLVGDINWDYLREGDRGR